MVLSKNVSEAENFRQVSSKNYTISQPLILLLCHHYLCLAISTLEQIYAVLHFEEARQEIQERNCNQAILKRRAASLAIWFSHKN